MKNHFKPFRLLLLALALVFVQCKDAQKNNESENVSENQEKNSENTMKIIKNDFGKTAAGEAVEQYTISNEAGLEMSVISYGGIITHLKVPNKDGKYEDVVLGFDNIQDYENGSPYFGAIIGRYGNRIADAKFSLDGEEYQLEKNDGPNSLHGGEKGFDKVVWDVEPGTSEDSASLKFTYTSKDGEGGFPGNLETTVTYTLTSDNELQIEYEATTDKKTVVNLTQHSYFNLTGDFSKTILDHVVEINADQYLPVDKTLIPTGELRSVEGTPFDFTEPTPVSEGMKLEESNEQLKRGPGFDHCWVLNEQDSGMRFAASAYDPESGRYMEVMTNEPAMQFYTGNFLDGTLPAKGGGSYGKRTGFCMETQHYPDSPNQEAFPSTVLEPGETYTSQTTYKFSVK
ncbi:galactose mutarotase [Gramella sp. GC03-9]|uniref:Aldose 1-epimerase n=1 Tax=Christiangramia oceanisediminis TaxID=2920386 RepID=A0A9X2I8E9_9FLAO|nr:aldose epimerase family protein [Gramella oceanisediminis]MCP9199117.1 galactose mutarotase [Gramella oceanisediminis]